MQKGNKLRENYISEENKILLIELTKENTYLKIIKQLLKPPFYLL